MTLPDAGSFRGIPWSFLSAFMGVSTITRAITGFPWIYGIVQSVLAKPSLRLMQNYIQRHLPPDATVVVDQGCGIGTWYEVARCAYYGYDINYRYIRVATEKFGRRFIHGSATHAPLLDHSCDVVTAVGLHHHLSDQECERAFEEARRALRSDGKLIVIDAMWPKSRANIVGWILRRIDAGGNVRTSRHTLSYVVGFASVEHCVLSSYPFDYVGIVARSPVGPCPP